MVESAASTKLELSHVSFQYSSGGNSSARSEGRGVVAGCSVLSDFSLSVGCGELVVVAGLSGRGKTTLLRLIAGLLRPDTGTIAIDGQVVAGPQIFLPAERRRVGFVFQDYALFPHMSVAQNVAFGLFQLKPKQRTERVQELLAALGLAAFAHRLPHEISGGQQQRVALARALAPRPSLLLMDEPFSNLDAETKSTVRSETLQFIVQQGMTALYVTHENLSPADTDVRSANTRFVQI